MKNLASKIQRLWEKTCGKKNELTFFERLLFLFLCVCEFFYIFGFRLVCFLKKKRGGAFFSQFKIISVGNLSLGGTGKSVVTQFLVKELALCKSAVVMRGYRGQASKTSESFLVSDGTRFFCDVAQSGDEAFMAAKQLRVPVVVGQNRVKSCKLLAEKKLGTQVVVLDDAYQNFDVKKDLQILLLDARNPFENGHCLPAGRLREKDFSRADMIFLTHADLVSKQVLTKLKKEVLVSFDQSKIFTGKHSLTDVVQAETSKSSKESIAGKKCLACAGVGSWKGFSRTLSQAGVVFEQKKIFENHHAYTHDDVKNLVEIVKKNNLHGVVTTYKDWYKIKPFLKLLSEQEKKYFYLLRIEFEFLSQHEYPFFKRFLRSTLKL